MAQLTNVFSPSDGGMALQTSLCSKLCVLFDLAVSLSTYLSVYGLPLVQLALLLVHHNVNAVLLCVLHFFCTSCCEQLSLVVDAPSPRSWTSPSSGT